jgi:hypothetical protein
MAALISNMVGDTTNGAAAKANRKARGSATASSARFLPDEGRVRWAPSNSADIPRSLRGRLLPDEGRARWTPSNSADIPRSLR